MEQSVYIISIVEGNTLTLADYQRDYNTYQQRIETYRKMFAAGALKGYVGVKVTLMIRYPDDVFGDSMVLHCEGAPPNKVLQINKQAKKA